MRTHFCGELNKTNLNDEVKLCGWVNRRRDHGGVIFLDVRDKKGIAQVVIKIPIATPAHLSICWSRLQAFAGESTTEGANIPTTNKAETPMIIS